MSIQLGPPTTAVVHKNLVSFAPSEFQAWLKDRQDRRIDRRDEVWDGVYLVMPSADNVHQLVTWQLASALDWAIDPVVEARDFAGCNVSDSPEDSTTNYRCPDVAVYLKDNPAEDRETHWLGGPDFAIEVVSKYDRSREKLEFHAATGVREVLYVDRAPAWSLELLRRDGEEWRVVGRVGPLSEQSLVSAVIPVNFRPLDAQPRPRIEVSRTGTVLAWLA